MTETLSPVADLGQDKKEENGTASNGKKAVDEEKYDTLELRNRSNKNPKIVTKCKKRQTVDGQKQDGDRDAITG